MGSSRYNVIYETGRDRKQRFCNEKHNYSDFGVLLGYWFEERARAEAETEELLYKYARNQLPFQKIDAYLNSLSSPVELTSNLDGFLHHGDVVRLKWTSEEGRGFFLSALPQRVESNGKFAVPCMATATEDPRILVRSAFHVFRNNNNIPNYIPLTYGERIQICTTESTGHRLLYCEPKSFRSFAKQSKHQEVTWEKELSARALWRVFAEDKKDRRRTEGSFIPVNTNLVLSHLATGHFLALEKDTAVSTTFGVEKEVACHTYLDPLKNECCENKWQFVTHRIRTCDYGEPIKFPPCGC